MIPQLIYLALVFIGFGISLMRNGKPKSGKHNFLGDLITASIIIWILTSGGFFDCFLK